MLIFCTSGSNLCCTSAGLLVTRGTLKAARELSALPSVAEFTKILLEPSSVALLSWFHLLREGDE